MHPLEALLYGILQGIAEFLPISSSGHLALAHNFFGASSETDLAFDVLLHLATLFAVMIVYRKEVLLLIKGFFSLSRKLFSGSFAKKNLPNTKLTVGEKLFLMLCISTIPLLPIALISDKVDFLGDHSIAVGILLICNGGMLFLSDRIASGKIPLSQAGIYRPFVIGCVQAFGVLPGISRSGSTITGGRICGLTREDAVKFSFLMSMPAILGACVLELPEFFSGGVPEGMTLPCIIGALAAFAVGLGAIKLLQFFSRKKGFTVFGVYCIVIGVLAIVAETLL